MLYLLPCDIPIVGHPKLINIFASARAFFPRDLGQARITSFLQETAIPGKISDKTFLNKADNPDRRRQKILECSFLKFHGLPDQAPDQKATEQTLVRC